MANDFDAIKAAFLAAQRGVAVGLDDTLDIVMVQFLGEATINLAAARGRDRWQPVPGPRIGTAPQVSDLTHQRTIVLVHALGKFLKVRNNGILREIDDARSRGRVLGHAGRATKHGQCDAALGLFFVVKLVALLGSSINRIQHRVTGAHDPVFERQMPQLKRLQQWIVGNHRQGYLVLSIHPGVQGQHGFFTGPFALRAVKRTANDVASFDLTPSLIITLPLR